jgi:DNA-binding protein H-NS
MARQKSLASMSVEALFALRDDVSRILSEKAQDLKQQLARLGGGEGGPVGNGRRRGASLKGRKVAPKYRDPDSGATWAGRGARPRWLQAAIKQGKKPDDFLIGRKKTAKGRKRKSA